MKLMALVFALGLAQQHPAMPPGMTHEEHLAQMKREAELKARGKTAMGFDQDAVSHHFLLAEDGGTIQVSVRAMRSAPSTRRGRPAAAHSTSRAIAAARVSAPVRVIRITSGCSRFTAPPVSSAPGFGERGMGVGPIESAPTEQRRPRRATPAAAVLRRAHRSGGRDP